MFFKMVLGINIVINIYINVLLSYQTMENKTVGGTVGKQLWDLKTHRLQGYLRGREHTKQGTPLTSAHTKKPEKENGSANSDPAQRSQETKWSWISACWSRINEGSHFQYTLGTLNFPFKLFLSDVPYTQLSPPHSVALSSWLLLSPLYFSIWSPPLCSLSSPP